MKKAILFTSLIFAAVLANAEALVFHEIRNDETLWFLSEVYYGRGDQFNKIMEANHVKADTKLEKGQRILIPAPVFHPGSKEFEARFEKMRKAREAKLAKKINKAATQSLFNFSNPVRMKSPEQLAEDELKSH